MHNSFDEPWRNAVVAASNPTALMECQLTLEYGIRNSWIKPLGTKLLLCLPSRAFSAKYATYSLVAIRLMTIDQSIRYEKVVLPVIEKPLPPKGSQNKIKKRR